MGGAELFPMGRYIPDCRGANARKQLKNLAYWTWMLSVVASVGPGAEQVCQHCCPVAGCPSTRADRQSCLGDVRRPHLDRLPRHATAPSL
jgi:hypothetical protein